MGGLEVAAVVFSLISAFRSGIDVVRRIGDKRRVRSRRRRLPPSSSASVTSTPRAQDVDDGDGEWELTCSLTRAPAEIGQEYEQNLAVLGERFARGDVVARASLAETLLKLNTGLVTLISAFLAATRESPEAGLDYRSLIRLSDDSRMEAIAALDGLFQRMAIDPIALLSLGSPKKSKSAKAVRGKEKKSPAGSKGVVALAPSLVTATSKPKGTAKIKGTTKSKLKASVKGRTLAADAPSLAPKHRRRHAASSSMSSTRPSVTEPVPPPAASERRDAKPAARLPRPGPLQAALALATPTLPPVHPPGTARPAAGPRLPTIPGSMAPPASLSPASPAVPVRASIYSFASDSTKLGEIPEYKWFGYTSSAAAATSAGACHPTNITRTPAWEESSSPPHTSRLPNPRRHRWAFFRRRSVDDGVGVAIGR
ncbi:MAG: hypothetical protein M1826_000619 [Phylliscum demangeonii]|nr:MAG: hypothetical protein M1826_000619 [Phylliscum demangeonii]